MTVTTVNVMEIMERIGSTIWVAVRLALFGSSGFFMLLYGSLSLAIYIDWTVRQDDPYSPGLILSFPIMVCGALLMLYAAGQWKRWAYLWVFFSMPISLLVLLLISIPFPFLAGEETSVLFFALAALVANSLVKEYYTHKFLPHEEEDSSPWVSMS